MNKKILIIIIFVFTFIFIGVVSFLRFRSYYNRHVISVNQWDEIISSRVVDNSLALSSLKFQDVGLLYDLESETYYYSYVDSSKKFNPSISYQSNDSIKVAFSDKITEELVRENHDFKILIYDKEKYHIYHMVVTGLPILNFDFSPDAMAGTKKNSVGMTLYDNRINSFHKIINSFADVTISDSNTDKKNFAFSLVQDSLGHNERENNISILGMMQHSEYVLNSMSDDSQLIRHIFSTNLWNSISNNNDKYQYVEVFMNNKYYGLYVLGYNIEREALRLGPGEFLFYKNSLVDSEEDYSFADKLDGYQLFDQNMERIPRGRVDNKRRGDNFIPNDAWTELKNSYKTLYSDDISQIKKYLSSKNAIDIYLFYLFSQATDNINSDTFANTYLIFRRNSTGYGLEYVPWNLNNTFGNINSNGEILEYNILPSDNSYIMHDNPVARLIELNDSTTINDVVSEFNLLRKSVLSDDNLKSLLDTYEANLYSTGAYIRESNKWDRPLSNESKLAVFKTYVDSRVESLEYFINNLK